MSRVKSLLLDWAPPALLRLGRRFYRGHGYFGNYDSWQAAQDDSSGYDAEYILQKISDAVSKVQRGEAVWERDSVLFDRIEYSWPILAGLLWVAAQNRGRLNVLDFGGSLGSTFYQNRKFLADLEEFQWNIVEQQHFIERGKECFEDETLRFYDNVEACLQASHPHVLLLSSVLPYLENTYETLASLLSHGFPYILVDKTHFVLDGDDRITVQKVPSHIYKASYPCRFLSESKFLRMMAKYDYELVEDFVHPDVANIPSAFKGFIFRNVHGGNADAATMMA